MGGERNEVNRIKSMMHMHGDVITKFIHSYNEYVLIKKEKKWTTCLRKWTDLKKKLIKEHLDPEHGNPRCTMCHQRRANCNSGCMLKRVRHAYESGWNLHCNHNWVENMKLVVSSFIYERSKNDTATRKISLNLKNTFSLWLGVKSRRIPNLSLFLTIYHVPD